MNAQFRRWSPRPYAGSESSLNASGCVYPYVDVKQARHRDTPAVPVRHLRLLRAVARDAHVPLFRVDMERAGRIIRLNYAIDIAYGVFSTSRRGCHRCSCSI